MQSALVWRLIVVLSTSLIGVAALAFPEYRQALVYGIITVIVGAVILWQYLRIVELQASQAGAAAAPKPVSLRDQWPEVVSTTLVLDMWRATSSFDLGADSMILVTADAPKRFVLHLATDLVDEATARKRRFNSVERTPESMHVRRTFKVAKAGRYSIVLEPAGASTFRAEVKVQQEPEPIISSF